MRRDQGLGAVRAVARAELRVRWRGLVVLGLLAGLAGGLVLGTAVAADRTASAHARLVDAVGLDDARVLVASDQPELAAAVARLPGVERAWTSRTWVAQIAGPALRFVSVGAGPDQPADLVRPVVVDGRAPDPDAADELLLSEALARNSGLGVGDEITLSLLTLSEIARFDVGFGAPDGATVAMRIVGIGRMPGWGGALSQALAGPAFAAAHGAGAPADAVFVRLAEGADRQAFLDGFAAAAAAADAAGPSVAARYLPPVVELPTAEVDPAVRAAERVLTGGLVVFGAVLAAGGLLVVGQGMLRHHGARRADQLVEAALGMSRGDRVAARVLAALPSAVLAGVVAAAVALAAGLVAPLGSQARFEPAPGFRPVWTYVVAGGAGIAVVVLALVAGAAAAAAAPGRPVAPLPRSAGPRRLWRGPALLVGVRLALRGRPSGGGLPAPATVLGAALAVAAIVAALTFGASLQRLVDEPARYGNAADLSLVDAREADVARLVADPRVAALDVASVGQVRIAGDPDGGETEVQAFERRKGALPVETVRGRLPSAPGEVALGPRVAQRLGVTIGDVVGIARPAGGTAALQVTGVAVPRADSGGGLGDAVVVDPARIGELSIVEPSLSAHILAAPGRADALFAELSADLEVFAREVPDEITNLGDLLELPGILAAVLAVVTGAALAHALLTAARRHAREVAVLSVLGATPGQVRATLAVMALATVLPALAVGVPLGVAAARVLWWQVATSTGVGGDVAVPVPALLVIGPAMVVLALLLALVPALRTARTPPAAALATA